MPPLSRPRSRPAAQGRAGKAPGPPRAEAPLSLAPSDCHARLLDLPPELGFQGGDVSSWQRSLRARLRSLLGWAQMPKRPGPLAVRTVFRRETELGTIEKLVFTAEPGADVPAYACVPRGAAGKLPWMVCLQGHSTGMHNSIGVEASDEATPMLVEGDRDFALGCMRRGVAALAIEQRSLGERKETKQERRSFHNSCHDAAMRALMLGRTLLGERVFDVARALDYLTTRDDVDRAKIGVMGNSGGGAVAVYAGALLPGVRFLMPSCCFCTFKASLLTIHHCADNYVPGLARVADMPDVLGLFAPRPVVLVAGEGDAIFPLAGVREAYERLRRIYRAAGAPDACRLVVGPEGHRFYADLAWREAEGLYGERMIGIR